MNSQKKRKAQKLRNAQKVYDIVTERGNGICEYCRSERGTIRHHIFLRNKAIPETKENIILLGNNCDDHNNGDFLMELKKRVQSHYFLMGYTEEEILKLQGGRLYLNQAGEIEKTLKAWWLE